MENDKVTVHTIPLRHRVPCSGFLFREKKKSRNLIKEKLPTDLVPSQLIALKKGENIIYEGKEIDYHTLTTPPKRQRSYAFCSDTIYDEKLVPLVESVDLLYHESTFTQVHAERAAQTFHSTAQQAAQIAQKAQVKRLLIGHFSSRYRDLNPLLNEAQAVFLATDLAIEGETFGVEE